VIGTEFHDWQRHSPLIDPRFDEASPNLLAIGDELAKRWGMTDLGTFGKRPVRGGTLPSSHSYGAATDRRYYALGRARAVSEVLPFLIDLSAELGVQAIHDYLTARIWRAGRTANRGDAHGLWWKSQPINPATGMGQSWAVYFHIETTPTKWGDVTPIPNRLTVTIPPPAPIPNPGGPFMHATIRKGSISADVFAAQVILRHRAGQSQVVCDGVFSTATEQAVRNVQAFTGQTVDGIVGPKTWAVLDLLANG
jgi:hypothetical protein